MKGRGCACLPTLDIAGETDVNTSAVKCFGRNPLGTGRAAFLEGRDVQGYRHLRKRVQMLAVCLAAMWAWPVLPAAAQSQHFVYLSSATAQTISGFEISQSSGAVTPVAGSPFHEGYDPNALAFHPTGRFLYAVNPGENNVSGFSVDPVTGTLTELAASPFAVGGGATPRFIAVEPAGRFLYVVGTVPDVQGTVTSVSYYAIDANGSVNPAAEGSTSPALFSPIGMVSKPGDRFVYVAGTTNADLASILALEIDPLTGTLSSSHISTVLGQFAKSVALAPGGQFLFIGWGQSQGSIDTYALPEDGIFDPPVKTFSIAGASGAPLALATDTSGAYLYAAVANLGLLGYSLDAGSGALSPLPGAPFVAPPISPSVVMAADPVMPFANFYYEERVFEILPSGALGKLAASPLAVAGGVTGIAAASPPDPIIPISGPVTSLSPSALEFPEQLVGNASPALSVSLVNTGNAPLLLGGEISLAGANASDFRLLHDCSAVVIQGSGCTIVITFEPASEGQRQASLTVVDNAPGSPHTVALTGMAQAPFTFQLDGSTSAIAAGQTARYDLRLVPASSFSGTVTLACSGVPDQGSCSFPASLDLGGGAPVLFSVTVTTKARSSMGPWVRPFDTTGRYPSYFVELSAAGAILVLLFLLLPDRKSRRTECIRPASHRTVAVLLICTCLILFSCSGTTGLPSTGSPAPAAPAPTPATGTPAGQYSLTVKASFGSVTEVIPLSLSIQ